MNSHASLPLISEPTRIEKDGGTLIDNIFNTNPHNCNSGILIFDIPDRLPSFVVLNIIIIIVVYSSIRDVTEGDRNDKFNQNDLTEIINQNDRDLAIKI